MQLEIIRTCSKEGCHRTITEFSSFKVEQLDYTAMANAHINNYFNVNVPLGQNF